MNPTDPTPPIVLSILAASKDARIRNKPPLPFPITEHQARQIAAYYRRLLPEDADSDLGDQSYYLCGGPLFGVGLERSE